MSSFQDIETENDRLRKRLRSFRHLVGIGPIVAILAPKEAEPAAPIVPEEPEPSRPSGPPNRSREEARRRRQMAARGLPVVEPAPVDPETGWSAELERRWKVGDVDRFGRPTGEEGGGA